MKIDCLTLNGSTFALIGDWRAIRLVLFAFFKVQKINVLDYMYVKNQASDNET